jgi:hypothetical protein
MQSDIFKIIIPSSEINRAIAVFEVINVGGDPLDEYDLIVARSARNKKLKSLSDRINDVIKNGIELSDAVKSRAINKNKIGNLDYERIIIDKEGELSKNIKNQFLNLLSIYSNTNYGEYELNKDENRNKLKMTSSIIKRKEILSLTTEQINTNTNIVLNAILRALSFFQIRCGIITLNDLNYQLMLLPVAYAFLNEDIWNNSEQIDKIEYWYWCSYFGGSYESNQSSQVIFDISDLYLWLIKNDNNARKKITSRFDYVFNTDKYSKLDILLNKDKDNPVSTAMMNGILQYVLSNQPKDFVVPNLRLNTWDIAIKKEFSYEGKYQELNIQDHHIYPLAGATNLGQSSKDIRKKKGHILNSPLNRTYISSCSNGIIRDKRIDEYLESISESSKYGHCIPAPIKQKYHRNPGETEESFYERILSERFYEISKEVKKELNNLYEDN